MRRFIAVLVAATLAGALAACSSGDDSAEAARPAPSAAYTAGDDVPVLVPGSPGEPAQVVEPGQSAAMANPDAWNDADATFATDMVGHHTQALAMAELAADRASDPRILRLAERITAAQGPEIETLQAWLAAQQLPAADEEAGHGQHADMPGMVTPEDMARLVAAEGAEFDRMFLELMTVHHEGAITMAEDAVTAQHPVVAEMVNDTIASQGAEITRMQSLLADLS